jgi:hypothetical protein
MPRIAGIRGCLAYSWFKKYGHRLAAESSDATNTALLSSVFSKFPGREAYSLQIETGKIRLQCRGISCAY